MAGLLVRYFGRGPRGVVEGFVVHDLAVWLAEGVAEMGNYWREGEQAVAVEPAVMAYLQKAEPKRGLLEIAVPGRTPSGTWQDYAWRWALCHMLANNPNYADRFKPLAIALMEERPDVSFDSVYGPVAKEVSFEYDQFLKTVGNGFRADLVAWPWKATGGWWPHFFLRLHDRRGNSTRSEEHVRRTVRRPALPPLRRRLDATRRQQR